MKSFMIRDFLENWVNWDEYSKSVSQDSINFNQFIKRLKDEWSEYTPEYAAKKRKLKLISY